jgi:hypothetical protein
MVLEVPLLILFENKSFLYFEKLSLIAVFKENSPLTT